MPAGGRSMWSRPRSVTRRVRKNHISEVRHRGADGRCGNAASISKGSGNRGKLGIGERLLMLSLPANEYVELRDGRHYYVPGTRIGLDVLIYAFRRGKTPAWILQAYPSIGSLA